ncbi:MAG: hypothetical protein QOF86_642 [Baekduia sp.]|nr:hypothetical protein [Baekduia sp.]
MAKMKVVKNRPMAAWLRRSSSRARTIRGENCPMASCTATSVTVSTMLEKRRMEWSFPPETGATSRS